MNRRLPLLLVATLLFLTPSTPLFAQADKAAVADAPKREQPSRRLPGWHIIPVLHEGRVKPLDTYARHVLLQFSGRDRMEDEDAASWMARLLFDPESTKEDKVFLINHPSIAESLSITPEEKRRYAFAQLAEQVEEIFRLAQQALQIAPEERDIVETEIIRVYNNLELYSQLSLTFSFAAPHSDFTITSNGLKEKLELPPEQVEFSYLTLLLKASQLHELSAPLEKVPPRQWSPEEQELMTLLNNIFHWSMTYHQLPLAVIPEYERDKLEWRSPWDMIATGIRHEEGRQELQYLQEMRDAYHQRHPLRFQLAAKGLRLSTTQRWIAKDQPSPRLELEWRYNQSQPFYWSKIGYLLLILLFLVSLIIQGPILQRGTFFLGVMILLLHGGGIAARMIILWRPPVSNLYETFLFVGFVGVLLSLLIERMQRNWTGILMAAMCGYIFLAIAGKFSTEGDTLEMLVAVLNSNFWLSTHVISITIGYAGVCLAGIAAHVYLLQRVLRPHDTRKHDQTYSVILGTLGFGLTMTFLGTNLGGIWADQSWGRFWGWDPKENGALMIVLWCALLFHLKVGRLIGPLGMAVGCSLGNMVVMWAWFGVNLLSIGLHSYGFTSGLATNLAIYYVLQILFLVVILTIIRSRRNAI